MKTRETERHRESQLAGRVAPIVDQKKVAPVIALEQGERGHVADGPCRRGPRACRAPFSQKEGADVTRVPVPVTRHTAPRRGHSNRGCWSFDGVFVMSAHARFRALSEEAGMT
ncbi:hypothetical protein GCM10010259_65810 [Streptomyces daghestanicus]|uniref:Uncharacterized protein n=1 Tax=Streptomyces daghestanicus TaxID=66885 RepID=A0ABQ3Q7K3_9ACTN|nr:hypothetical protein GCM10010259_65810 [Streptomyces daghestanicus]GHI33235.1 hypothetical protein Sdagh_49650 [Streptomyces daghestanicus]